MDGRYRYWLERRWDESLPRFTFVLLNPSSAGADTDDPTNRRLRALTSANGGGSYELVNLFALVDTHQRGLGSEDAVGESTAVADRWILEAARRADVLVLGWGTGSASGAGAATRQANVVRRAKELWPRLAPLRPQCVATTRSGAPGHPLYLRADTVPIPYMPPAG